MHQHLLWYLISVNSGTVTPRSVHPASPVLLTKNGPLETHNRNGHVQLSDGPISHIQSLRIVQGHYDPDDSNHSLYRMNLNKSLLS
jgi:hypothetical protein